MFELKDLMADRYGPRTASTYDKVVNNFAWDYQATLKAISYEAIVSAGKIDRGTDRLRVLDIGAGTGNLSTCFLDVLQKETDSCRVDLVCLDSSEAMLDVASSKLTKYSNVEARTVVSSIEQIGENISEGFDLVLSSFSLHHLSPGGKEKAISEVSELLSPDGVFVLGDRTEEETTHQDYLRVIASPLRKFEKCADLPIEDLSDAMHKSFVEDLDQPDSVEAHLNWFRAAGFTGVRCPFFSFGFAVISGRLKSKSSS